MLLSREFRLQSNELQDTTLGIRHGVISPGEQILSLLDTGAELRHIRRAANTHGIKDFQITELIGFLNVIGALVCKRRWYGHIAAIAIRARDACLNIYYTPFSWRHPAGALPLVRSIFRATLPVITASAFVIVLFLYAGKAVYSIGAFGIAVFLASLFCHELTHILIAAHSGRRAALLQRGLRLGVIHASLSPSKEIFSALAGPGAGLLCGLVAAAVAYANGAELMALAGIVSGCFHLGSLIPWYGDGASLRSALRGARP